MNDLLNDSCRNIEDIRIKSRKGDFGDLLMDYFTIRLEDLSLNSIVTFDIYFPFLNRLNNTFNMRRILDKGSNFSLELQETLLQKGINKVHITREDLPAFTEYLSLGVKLLISSSEAPLAKKMEHLYQNAHYVMQVALSDPRMGENIERGSELMETMADFFAAEKVTARALYSIFSKDYTTFTHSVQVCLLGIAFYNYLGLSKKESADMGLGGLFHDLGKNLIDARILNKPTKLTEQEFAMVKRHPILGYKQVYKWDKMQPDGLAVILHHHEALDGTGYPSGLKGSEINPHARVAHILDCYDALTTTRSYKKAVSPYEALRIMGEEMKHSFDTNFFKHFVKFLAL